MTFAEYLARYYTGRRGFQPGTVPEAAALAWVRTIDFLQETLGDS